MSHGVRIRTDAAWALGTQWLTSEKTALDNALFASVDGDGGGSWAPTSPIILGGAGIRLVGTTPHTLTGAASIARTSISAGALLVHNDSDYCKLGAAHAGATASIRSPCTAVLSEGTWFFIQSLPLTAVGEGFAILTAILGSEGRIPIRVHNGSILSTVTFTFTVGVGASAIPAQLPQFGIFAADLYGNVYPLSAATPHQSVSAPASPAAWSDSGNAQTFTYTADSSASNPYVLIDTARFSYFASIIEASGAGAVSEAVNYYDPVANFIDIQDIQPR